MNSLRVEQDTDTELHGYTASINDTMHHIQKIERASTEDLTTIYNIKSIRAPLIPACTELMKGMHNTFASENIIASRGGVRDGLLAQQKEELPSSDQHTFKTKLNDKTYG